jgi:excisionase family DNA binding protein
MFEKGDDMTYASCIQPSLPQNPVIHTVKTTASVEEQNQETLLKTNETCTNNCESIIDKCITKNELARTLGVSISLINRLMAEGEIPYLKLGRVVRFQTKDVFAWFQKRKLQS